MAQLSKNRSATLKVIHDLEKSETKILFSKWDCSKVSVRVMGLRRNYLVICSILDDLFGRQNPCFLYIAPAYCCGFLITNMKSTKYFLIHLYLLDTWYQLFGLLSVVLITYLANIVSCFSLRLVQILMLEIYRIDIVLKTTM